MFKFYFVPDIFSHLHLPTTQLLQYQFYNLITLYIEVFIISKHEHTNCITTSYVDILFFKSGKGMIIHRSILSIKMEIM